MSGDDFVATMAENVAAGWSAMSIWEALAVVLALVYLLLAVRQNRLCWIAALLSTALFTALFWRVQLLMQSLLNVYYMAMAIYGWWHWGRGAAAGDTLPIVRWRWQRHAALGIGTALLALITGTLLDRHTDAVWPFVDSLVTWAAVFTTWMVARKVLENWAWWMVINSLAVLLFFERGMALTAALHLGYLLISIFGWRRWWQDYRSQRSSVRPPSGGGTHRAPSLPPPHAGEGRGGGRETGRCPP